MTRKTIFMATLSSVVFSSTTIVVGEGFSNTMFTYQGRLTDQGLPANGPYAFEVRLIDEDKLLQVGNPLCEDQVIVSNGLFTLLLDFGVEAAAPLRSLEISVQKNGDCDDNSNFLLLEPRQPITPSPSAVRALTAGHAASTDFAIQASFATQASSASLAAAARRLDAPDGSPSNAVFVDNDGAVGIGTTSPQKQLSVNGGMNIDQANLQNGVLAAPALTFGLSSQEGISSRRTPGANQFGLDFYTQDFAIGPRMSITQAGRVGIGTATPTSKLDIRGGDNSGPGSLATLILIDNNAHQMIFDANEIDGTAGLFLNNNTVQNVTLATGGGNVGIGTLTPAHKLQVEGGPIQIANSGDQADLLWLSSERSWVFRQEGTDSTTALKLQSVGGGGNKSFFFQTTGGVGIGRNPALNNFEVEGTASKTAAGSWLANSDTAIKTNVRTISNALAVIGRLRPVAFRYTEEYQAKHPSVKDQDYYNYIAQEFREVFPEWVHDSGEDGLLQMDEYPAGVYAVAAIQELNAVVRDKTCEIDNLMERERSKDQRLDELEVRNAKLQARLERLEALLETRVAPQAAD